jgi:hypothetical protein
MQLLWITAIIRIFFIAIIFNFFLGYLSFFEETLFDMKMIQYIAILLHDVLEPLVLAKTCEVVYWH